MIRAVYSCRVIVPCFACQEILGPGHEPCRVEISNLKHETRVLCSMSVAVLH